MIKIPLNIKFLLVFGLTGFFLSFLTGLFSGVMIGTVFLRAFIFLIVFSGMGFGFYQILNSKFQEILHSTDDDSADMEDADQSDSEKSASEDEAGEGYSGDTSGEAITQGQIYDTASPKGRRKDDGNFGDHIIVEGVKIENQPQLMASAIRTIMSKDENQ